MSEVIRETTESWKRFSRTQKLAAVVTNLLTVSRPVLTAIVARRGFDKDYEWTTKDALELGGAYLTDMEGGIARTYGAQTKLGGVLDPLADKLAMSTQEINLAMRGEESYARVGIKLARDIGISALRRHVLTASRTENSEASVSANWSGKANTAFRKSAIVFASSPLGAKFPKTRTALQVASAASTVASGIITAKQLYGSTKKASREEASREA